MLQSHHGGNLPHPKQTLLPATGLIADKIITIKMIRSDVISLNSVVFVDSSVSSNTVPNLQHSVIWSTMFCIPCATLAMSSQSKNNCDCNIVRYNCGNKQTVCYTRIVRLTKPPPPDDRDWWYSSRDRPQQPASTCLGSFQINRLNRDTIPELILLKTNPTSFESIRIMRRLSGSQ